MVDVLQKIGRDHVRRKLTPQHFEVLFDLRAFLSAGAIFCACRDN